ncbi:MAG: Fur family transcriptional regulator [Actinomycetota bacterium]
MNPVRQEIASRMKRFEETLRQNGVKATHQRTEIYRAAMETADHPDAETIYRQVRRKIPSISLDTVYRNLWLYNDLGLVGALGPPRGRLRFDANTSPHHHFSCRGCGKLEDFESPAYDSLPLPERVRGMGEVEGVHVELKGLCNKCLKKG